MNFFLVAGAFWLNAAKTGFSPKASMASNREANHRLLMASLMGVIGRRTGTLTEMGPE